LRNLVVKVNEVPGLRPSENVVAVLQKLGARVLAGIKNLPPSRVVVGKDIAFIAVEYLIGLAKGSCDVHCHKRKYDDIESHCRDSDANKAVKSIAGVRSFCNVNPSTNRKEGL
jgi:hypothetical protein